MIRTHEDIAAGLSGLAMLDARLSAVIAKAGPVPLRRSDPGYAGMARIIVAQMVSRASAEAIWRRMEGALGVVTAEAFLLTDDDQRRAFGLSRAKAETLHRVARAVADEVLDLDALCTIDGALALREMTAIKGVGRWTAEVYLLFCAGHPDVFPVGDVALQAAVGHAFFLEARPSALELDDLTQAWTPWRSIAARLFWAYYAQEMRRSGAPVVE